MTTMHLPYLLKDTDRHGNPRIYVRRYGKRIRLLSAEGSAAFAIEYAEALKQLATFESKPKQSKSEPKPHTFAWLAAKYFAESVEFKRLDPASQSTRRGIIEECLRENTAQGASFRDCPVSKITPRKIKTLRDQKADLPGAANNRLKYLSPLFTWAIEEGLLQSNPCRDVRRLSYATDGFYTWTVDDVRQYEERHPIGTQARLALALLLFLGARKGDLVTLGKQHMRGPTIKWTARKSRHKRLDAVEKPVLPILAEIITASPTGSLTFLETEYGRPFTAKGFGNKMRDWCDQANLHQASAHGLRKAAATIAAENGATISQLMAIFDWESERQAIVYTKAADRKRLAASGMALLAKR